MKNDGKAESDCAETARRVFAYIDGELTPEQVAEIEAHLDDCGHCHKVHDIERKLVESIRNPTVASDVQALQARVLAALKAAKADT